MEWAPVQFVLGIGLTTLPALHKHHRVRTDIILKAGQDLWSPNCLGHVQIDQVEQVSFCRVPQNRHFRHTAWSWRRALLRLNHGILLDPEQSQQTRRKVLVWQDDHGTVHQEPFLHPTCFCHSPRSTTATDTGDMCAAGPRRYLSWFLDLKLQAHFPLLLCSSLILAVWVSSKPFCF